MIDPKAITSYAQFNEDTILLALFPDVKKGFYIDIGANYPTIDSVTKSFYDNGWSGINIEPLPSLYRQLTKERPRDINLQIGIGSKIDTLEFYENPDSPGHSSFKMSAATSDLKDVKKLKTYNINVRPLKDVLSEVDIKNINFLKIDVEGYEKEVLEGNDWVKYRPSVICVEANHRISSWENILVKKNYKLFINDGLNEYYIATESWKLTDDFAERVVRIAYNTLKQHQFESWSQDSRQLKELTLMNKEHFELLQKSKQENQRLLHGARLSLSDRSFLERVKRALYGLTIDWVKYRLKKQSNK